MTSSRSPRGPGATSGSGALGDLFLRTLSALVMAAAALLLTWSGPWPFAFLLALAFGVLAWEWAVIRGCNGLGLPVISQTAVVAICLALATAGYWTPAFALLGLGILVSLLPALASSRRQAYLSALGMLLFAGPALSLLYLRSDPQYGLAACLFVFAIVWGADTSAYLFGRLIGGPKLAPAISPGKTWAGFLAGLAVPALIGYAFARALASDAPMQLSLVALALALVAQLGDLLESATKRKFGVKDSSALIPGHGGLLDRVDGLLSAAAAAALLALTRNMASPGSALLIWP